MDELYNLLIFADSIYHPFFEISSPFLFKFGKNRCLHTTSQIFPHRKRVHKIYRFHYLFQQNMSKTVTKKYVQCLI